MVEGTGVVEAEVEVVMAVTRMATTRPHSQTLPIMVHRRLPTATDAVEYPTITHTDPPRGHHHSNNTEAGTVRAVPGRSRHLLPTAGTLTQMAVVPHRGRFLARIVGAEDITLVGPQVEADMVVVVAATAVPEADTAVAAVGVMDTDMVAEEGSIILHRIRADIVLAAMMVATVLGVAVRREDVAEAEVSDALRLASWTYSLSTFFISVFCISAY